MDSDPIPTIRRYHTDPVFRASVDAERQAHYDAFYCLRSSTSSRGWSNSALPASMNAPRSNPMRADKIKRASPFDPATYATMMAPHHARKAVDAAHLINQSMRAQRPQLREF